MTLIDLFGPSSFSSAGIQRFGIEVLTDTLRQAMFAYTSLATRLVTDEDRIACAIFIRGSGLEILLEEHHLSSFLHADVIREEFWKICHARRGSL